MKFSFKIDPRTRHAGLSALISVGALVGLIILNLLFSEFRLRLDITRDKLFSLRPETVRLLEGNEAEVEIIALYIPGQEPENIMQVINEYPKKSSMVKVRVLDPDKNPTLIASFGEDIQAGSIIVKSGERNRVITYVDLYEVQYTPQGQPQVVGQRIEQQISSAIAFVASPELPVIYEITGHKELTLSEMGYKEVLERANYKVKELGLNVQDIPEDASLLTLIGPNFDISMPELDKLRNYLKDGGKLLVAVDYLLNETLDNLSTLLSENGIEMLWGVAFEKESSRLLSAFPDNPLVFVPYLSSHESIASLSEYDLTPIFQTALGFKDAFEQPREPWQEEPEESEEAKSFSYTSLLYTSGEAFFRTELNSGGPQVPERISGDEDGPVDIVSVSEGPKDSLIIAMGSANTLAGLPLYGQTRANLELLTNVVDWAIDDSATVNIGSKTLFRDPLVMGRNLSLFYAILVAIIIPLVCIVSGIVVFRKRRNQ